MSIGSIDAQGYDGPKCADPAAKDFGHLNIRGNLASPGWNHASVIEELISAEALAHMQAQFYFASDRASGIYDIDLSVDYGALATLYIYESLPHEWIGGFKMS